MPRGVYPRRVGRVAQAAAVAPSAEEAAQDEALLTQVDKAVEQRTAERAASRSSGATDRRQPRHDPSEFLDEDGTPIRRRVNREANPFDIEDRYKKPGWDYAWWVVRVQGEQVDLSYIVEIREGGWRPVLAKDIPGLVPPGWDKSFIERGGQVLYMRPKHLTEESRAEDIKIAENQRYEKLQGALAGPAELAKIAPRQVVENELYGSVGIARQRS